LIITLLVYWGEGHIYRFCSKMAKVELRNCLKSLGWT
jgi:hypothetical protein